MATFTEQSHLTMPPPGWLHVNGVSLSTDVQQQVMHPSDQRTKTITSPMPVNFMPFTATNTERQYQKLENADLPKKLFIDRQIKKAKSLPGLIKGTALSHHSAPSSNPSTNHTDDEPLPMTASQNDEESSPSTRQNHERTNDTRRPRVSFSDFNKVQFFEDNNNDAPHRRRRHRSPKKSTAVTGSNPVSPPSIQQSQSLYAPYRPLSRQQPIGHELNIRKHHLVPSPRIQSSRMGHLPDILNQSLPMENPPQDKYQLQREKSFFQFPEPAMEIPMNSSTEISRESTRAGGIRPSPADYYDQNNLGINTLLNSTSISSSLTSRQRPTLRTISLRHQFTSPLKSKPINFSNNTQTITNSRRSASLKHTIIRNHSVDDEQDELQNHHLLSTLENRPGTGNHSSKHVKRNYIIHFNSKNPFNGNPTMEASEISRPNTKTNFQDSSQERFQNVLKIVRPPYITGINTPHPDSALQVGPSTNHINGSIRSSRATSGHGAHDYHLASNTIFV